MSVRGCLMAAEWLLDGCHMAVAARWRREIDPDRDLWKKPGQAWQPSVKLGINRLFRNGKIGQVGALRRWIRKQFVANFHCDEQRMLESRPFGVAYN
jgi:hypothetical protein